MVDSGDRDDPVGVVGWIRWALTTDKGSIAYIRDIAGSILAVVLIGALLFGISGVWPPMVAIESGSMQPHIQKGDLVFVMEEHRFAADGAIEHNGESTGVVPYKVAKQSGYKEFNNHGDVIIYEQNGNEKATRIIHRARFWVDKGENWYDKANPKHIGGANNCNELDYCPAPYGGFITKGDNKQQNRLYDQVAGISAPVKPDWIVGTAEFRIPYLGFIRLGAGTMSGFGISLGTSFLGMALLGGGIASTRGRR